LKGNEIMKKAMILSVLACFLNGCGEPCNCGSIFGIETCRKNLAKLNVGMTKEQAREAMEGEPYRVEARGQTEWWLYATELPRWRSESEFLTPLLFEDGKLVGWGKNYWTTREQKYDVKIDQTIQQK
jgi:outer membrane protein assembly factor BamE (lipoprotein component of BamABCDE complex)